MNAIIKKLIANLNWPGIDSIIYGDGQMTLLDIEFYGNQQYYIGPIADTTIESYLKYNEDLLSAFDISARAEYGNYRICVGDGSEESNGVVFIQDKRDNCVVWFAFFENSDPFKSVSVEEGVVSARTNTGVCWKINIEDPLSISLVY